MPSYLNGSYTMWNIFGEDMRFWWCLGADDIILRLQYVDQSVVLYVGLSTASATLPHIFIVGQPIAQPPRKQLWETLHIPDNA